jgi:putative flippase GtrA
MAGVFRVFASRQFGVFLMVGGIAAAANFGAGAVVRHLSPAAPVGVGVDVGMVVGIVLSFFLNRRHTFQVGDAPMGPQAARFAVVSAGSMVLAFVLSEGTLALWRIAGSPLVTEKVMEALAHVGAIGANTLYGFVAMKFFALKRTEG